MAKTDTQRLGKFLSGVLSCYTNGTLSKMETIGVISVSTGASKNEARKIVEGITKYYKEQQDEN